MKLQSSLQNLSYRMLIALTIILAVGTYLRVLDVTRPVDGSATLNSTIWREVDVASIAQNFYREDNNILYPRTLWRENTPGYVESELPLYPWLVAQLYRVFGYHEQLARFFSLLISALTLLVLSRLSFIIFNEIGALVATAFFAVNPLLIYLSTAIQSDTLMLLFLSVGLYYYLRHTRTPSNRLYLISVAFVALAVLCKATAVPYALFVGLDTLRREGWRQTFSNKTTYIAFAILVLPNLAWVIHSQQFWLDNGLSLGVSNESHAIGFDMLFNLKYYRGFLSNTFSYITSYPGAVALLVGLWTMRKSIIAKPIYVLGVSLLVFYFSILYTTGSHWAFYYHALTIPFAGLVFGTLAQEITFSKQQLSFSRSVVLVGVPVALAGVGIGLALGFSFYLATGLGILSVALASLLLYYQSLFEFQSSKKSTFTPNFVVTVMAITLIALGARSFRFVPQEKNFVEWNQCALSFAESVPETSRIACWGATSRSSTGRAIAYHAPWMFYWMDRKGFSIPENVQSVEAVDSVGALGADFYIEYLPGSERTPGFHEALQQRFTVVDSCGAHMLYFLR